MRSRWSIASRAKLILTCLCFAIPTVHAGPKVLEPQTTVFTPPPERFPYLFDVALDGNRLAVATFPDPTRTRNVYVYERSAQGVWGPPVLALTGTGVYHAFPVNIALQGNIVAMTFRNQLQIAERTASGWQQTAMLATPPGITEMGSDIDIDGGTIVVAGESNRAQAIIFRKSAAGVWGYAGHVNGETFAPGSYEDFYGGDVDISGNTIVVGATGLVAPPETEPHARVFVYTNNNGSWVQSAVLPYPLQQAEPYSFGQRVGVEGDTLILGEAGPTLHLYRRSGTTWTYASSVRPPEVAIGPRGSPAISGDLVAQTMAGSDTIHLFQRDGTQLRPVAKLLGPASEFDLHGRSVASIAGTQLVLFSVPTDLSQPPLIQDNFQDGNANGWNPFLTTSWTVTTSGTTRVYRQTNLASEARSILTGTDWTNQAVQADIKPTEFDGADRWFGLAARFTDPANYYYVTLRSSNTLLLRRMVNGTFQTLVSRTLPVALNRTQRVRLEAIGSRIRVYVGDALMAEAVDRSLSHGQAGLLTYRTRANFDNVLVSPNPLLTLFGDAFHVRFEPGAWIETGTGVWAYPPEEPSDPDFPDPNAAIRNYRQTSLNGGARSHTGAIADDQTVQALARPTSLTPTGWFGVMARYVDDGNYYYLKVGSNGEASLRKLVDGGIFELARAPLAVTAGNWYTLRLEVVGTTIRAYVNDQFLMEATDSSHAAGKYGIVTYRAAATFDDFVVRQP